MRQQRSHVTLADISAGNTSERGVAAVLQLLEISCVPSPPRPLLPDLLSSRSRACCVRESGLRCRCRRMRASSSARDPAAPCCCRRRPGAAAAAAREAARLSALCGAPGSCMSRSHTGPRTGRRVQAGRTRAGDDGRAWPAHRAIAEAACNASICTMDDRASVNGRQCHNAERGGREARPLPELERTLHSRTVLGRFLDMSSHCGAALKTLARPRPHT